MGRSELFRGSQELFLPFTSLNLARSLPALWRRPAPGARGVRRPFPTCTSPTQHVHAVSIAGLLARTRSRPRRHDAPEPAPCMAVVRATTATWPCGRVLQVEKRRPSLAARSVPHSSLQRASVRASLTSWRVLCASIQVHSLFGQDRRLGRGRNRCHIVSTSCL